MSSSNLVDLIRSANRFFVKDALIGAGLTLGTGGAILAIINTLIDKFRDDVTNLPPMVLQYAALAGFDYSISIVLGAVSAKAIQDSSKLILLRN
ncbi:MULTISPECIES: DUF2523 family protein [unclassified Moraxella]|uniref:DUF2523 family protein n=1 Tax=unclassified Moraxella TaxID=2685852 RepID=UPI003AF8DAD0